MRRVLILTCVLFAAAVSSAYAAAGNGLYNPFPADSNSGAAQSYYAQLGVTMAPRQLSEGQFAGGLGLGRGDGPSERAGERAVGIGTSEFAAVAALALLGAAVAARRTSRRAGVRPC